MHKAIYPSPMLSLKGLPGSSWVRARLVKSTRVNMKIKKHLRVMGQEAQRKIGPNLSVMMNEMSAIFGQRLPKYSLKLTIGSVDVTQN